MKSWSDGRKGFVFRLVCSVLVVVVMGGAGALIGFKLVASSNFAAASSMFPNPVTPTPPSDNTLGLSITSGPPGTHVFISASGFGPKESVRPIWNYGGPGTVVVENSFYYFNPASTSDSNGVVYMSFFVPTFPTGNYTIAAKGATSGTIKTAAFHLTPSFETGGLIGNYFYALNAVDGSLIWENYLDKGPGGVDPIVRNGVVYVPSALKEAISGGLSAFDANTGATIWSNATPYGIWSSPTMDPSGTNLYVNTGNPCLDDGGSGCSGYAQDYNPATGALIWQYHVVDITADDDNPTTLTYGSDGNVYFGSKNGIFYCLNATTGAVVQQYDTGSRGDSGIFSSAALYNGKVYFGGGDFKIHALDTDDFSSLAWSFTSNRIFMSSPAAANGVIYSGGGDGRIYAFDATSGTKLWSYNFKVTVLSSPMISKGVLYVSASDGYFYAFSLGGV